MRELKLRPFKGMFSTNRLPIRVLTDASVAFTMALPASTVIDSDAVPTLSLKFSSRLFWTLTVTPVSRTILNPFFSTSMR